MDIAKKTHVDTYRVAVEMIWKYIEGRFKLTLFLLYRTRLVVHIDVEEIGTHSRKNAVTDARTVRTPREATISRVSRIRGGLQHTETK